jgi:isopentenyldiphosphate isomerase
VPASPGDRGSGPSPDPYSDPNELFDVYLSDGTPAGRVKRRADVHRDGDWHRSFHCWVVSPDPDGPRIVLQRRSPEKETWAGLWDVSVGGHYSAGEGLDGGIREMHEELGLTVSPLDLVHVGWRREEVFYPNGLIEREIQDIFFLLRALGVDDLRPEPSEVAAVALIHASALERLASGRSEREPGRGGLVRPSGRVEPGAVDVDAGELVPRTGDYYRKAARFARALAGGTAVVRRRRWW